MNTSTGASDSPGKSTEMNTLSAVLTKAIKNGYQENFNINRKGLYSESSPDKLYAPEDIQVENFYRFEGESDPGDMSILYVIRTADDTKGTLIDAYGTYSDVMINDFMKQVEDIRKHVDKKG